MMKKCVILMLQFYQRIISPLFPPTCRFYPSCSEYSRLSFIKYGFFKGLCLTVRRVSKCHPFHPGGFDPVP